MCETIGKNDIIIKIGASSQQSFDTTNERNQSCILLQKMKSAVNFYTEQTTKWSQSVVDSWVNREKKRLGWHSLVLVNSSACEDIGPGWHSLVLVNSSACQNT